ncbi:unnamed protein product [Nippostrongylus brasiliensis]|uniref:Monooxygenase n=1 Tax=Nippostrongylus brasiliensis TaxID=27835 RepID=A0A0N4XUV1_NIPBR|nr:unnamed protein product [Nippostrongylus brasiliensis]
MRTSNPNREAIETVARESLDETLGLVANLEVSAKRAAVAVAWTSVVLDSLECESRGEFVERLAEFISVRDSVRTIVSDNTMSIEQIPGVLVDVLKSNEMLQEQ